MEHTVFAVFGDLVAAERAVEELLASDLCKEHHVSVVVHRSVDPERLDALVQYDGQATETDGAPAAVRGALIGGVLGAVLAGPLGLMGAGPVASALFGATMGAAHGALAGGLIGLGLPDTALKHLAAQLRKGDTLITVQADSKVRERDVETFLIRQGARIVEKHLLFPAASRAVDVS
jgi:uncharacterized membrane protein